uniref:Uncharacterized protein n=1 Tax=Candidatus Kentrum sp. FW TaxID=2126338 RepID=A0A450T4V3_9GAMM|nr:MAG: hypothetical protein BECKFW1821B_GA0114236_106713 [Candidatus Kentron sp. FW]
MDALYVINYLAQAYMTAFVYRSLDGMDHYCFPYMAVMIHHVAFLGRTYKKSPSQLRRKGRFFTYLRMPPTQLLDDLLGGNGNYRPRSEDGGSSMLIEEIVVLSGDDAADYHHDVFPIQSFELFHQLRQ